jgi:putative SOS response-associated peptidase YedK
MCGRYVTPEEAALERYWELKRPGSPFKGLDHNPAYARANYNTTPTQMVPIERIGESGPEIVRMRWGMDRENHATGQIEIAKLNNARLETVRRINPFAQPFKTGKRGLQLVKGYYEWKEKARPPNWKVRVPHFIHPLDQGEVFALACIYDLSLADETLLSCSVITMQATGRLAEIDERMPAILRLEDHQTWLTGTPEEAYALLKPYPDEKLHITRVRPEVNSSYAKGPQLIEPDPNPEPEPPTEAEIAAEAKRKAEEKDAKKQALAAKREAEKEEKKRVKEAEREAKLKAKKETGQGDLF